MMNFVEAVVLLLSVIGNIFLVTIGFMLYKFFIPPSAMLLIKKRMGMLKDSVLAMVCFDDGAAAVKALKISSEGCLEHSRGDGTSETYYLAKPSVDSGDVVADRAAYRLDKIMLPSLSVDGIPLALCYSLDGVATNANVLLGLQTANLVSESSPDSFDAVVHVPGSVGVQRMGAGSGGGFVDESAAAPVVLDPVLAATFAAGKGKKGKGKVRGGQSKSCMSPAPAASVGVGAVVRRRVAEIKIRVLLPITPLDIHRTFPLFWDMNMLESTKQRYKNIGAAMNKKDGNNTFKLLVIVGAVAGISFAIAGVVAGWIA